MVKIISFFVLIFCLSPATRSQQKKLNSIDPCDREFNFELWANLVREQMQTVLHRAH